MQPAAPRKDASRQTESRASVRPQSAPFRAHDTAAAAAAAKPQVKILRPSIGPTSATSLAVDAARAALLASADEGSRRAMLAHAGHDGSRRRSSDFAADIHATAAAAAVAAAPRRRIAASARVLSTAHQRLREQLDAARPPTRQRNAFPTFLSDAELLHDLQHATRAVVGTPPAVAAVAGGGAAAGGAAAPAPGRGGQASGFAAGRAAGRPAAAAATIPVTPDDGGAAAAAVGHHLGGVGFDLMDPLLIVDDDDDDDDEGNGFEASYDSFEASTPSAAVPVAIASAAGALAATSASLAARSTWAARRLTAADGSPSPPPAAPIARRGSARRGLASAVEADGRPASARRTRDVELLSTDRGRLAGSTTGATAPASDNGAVSPSWEVAEEAEAAVQALSLDEVSGGRRAAYYAREMRLHRQYAARLAAQQQLAGAQVMTSPLRAAGAVPLLGAPAVSLHPLPVIAGAGAAAAQPRRAASVTFGGATPVGGPGSVAESALAARASHSAGVDDASGVVGTGGRAVPAAPPSVRHAVDDAASLRSLDSRAGSPRVPTAWSAVSSSLSDHTRSLPSRHGVSTALTSQRTLLTTSGSMATTATGGIWDDEDRDGLESSGPFSNSSPPFARDSRATPAGATSPVAHALASLRGHDSMSVAPAARAAHDVGASSARGIDSAFSPTVASLWPTGNDDGFVHLPVSLHVPIIVTTTVRPPSARPASARPRTADIGARPISAATRRGALARDLLAGAMRSAAMPAAHPVVVDPPRPGSHRAAVAAAATAAIAEEPDDLDCDVEHDLTLEDTCLDEEFLGLFANGSDILVQSGDCDIAAR